MPLVPDIDHTSSVWQLLIILAIVLLLFGTRCLRSFGSDLGESISNFRNAVCSEDNEDVVRDAADYRLIAGTGYLSSDSKPPG